MVKELLTIGFVAMVWSLLGIAQSSPQTLSGSGPNARMQEEAGKWRRMHDLGLKYKTAWELYMVLKMEAGGGKGCRHSANYRTGPDCGKGRREATFRW